MNDLFGQIAWIIPVAFISSLLIVGYLPINEQQDKDQED
jgi:hypothetical protein